MTYDPTYWGPGSLALALALGFAVALIGSELHANSGQLMLPEIQGAQTYG